MLTTPTSSPISHLLRIGTNYFIGPCQVRGGVLGVVEEEVGDGMVEGAGVEGAESRGALRRQAGGESAFTARGEGKGGTDMLRRKSWEVGEEFNLGHSTGQVIQYVVHGDPGTLEAGLPAANIRLYFDIVVYVVHMLTRSLRKSDRRERSRRVCPR